MNAIDTDNFSANNATNSRHTSFYNQQLSVKDRKDPRKIGGSLESIFYRQIFKILRESALDEGLLDGFESQQLREMQHDELAEKVGHEGKLGIVDLVVDAIEMENKSKIHLDEMYAAQREGGS